MNARALLAAALLLSALRFAGAAEPSIRSVGGSGQFVVYCADAALRGRVMSLVEDTKSDVLTLLGETVDRRKIPIVITIQQAESPGQKPPQVRLLATPEGSKIEINVSIGSDPAAIHLQKQIIRALLLEYAWRERPPIQGGEAYLEAPWWVVEGAIQIFRRRDLGLDSDLFQRLIENNKLPSIEQFLALRTNDLGSTAEAIDAACAMGFLQLLIEQPNGRANLARLVRHWPDRGDDPMKALTVDFPSLAAGDTTVQKWWTLNLARFAAANRYKGLSAAETDKQLSTLLHFEIPIDKAGKKQTFALAEYDQFARLPASRPVLENARRGLLALGTQAHALYRPSIAEYERILAILARGKTRQIAERISRAEEDRTLILRRLSDITDYLNWYEATQMRTRSNAFDGYIKAANALSEEEKRRLDPIARYLDQLEKEL